MKSKKCLLNICGTYFLVTSAEKAAQVMDALATFEPVSIIYSKTAENHRCHVIQSDYSHKAAIESAPADLMTPAQLEAAEEKWLKEEAAAAAATTATILPEAA